MHVMHRTSSPKPFTLNSKTLNSKSLQDGTTYQYHPEMDRLIAEHLAKANDAVRAQIKEALLAQDAYDADLQACTASARKAV
jgi:hypothetical protein